MKKIYWIASCIGSEGEIRVELFGTEEKFNERIDGIIQERGSEEVRWMLNDLDANTYAAAWEQFCEEMKEADDSYMSGVQEVEIDPPFTFKPAEELAVPTGGLIKVYARRERTTDAATADMRKAMGIKSPSNQMDVQIYRDPEAKVPFARFSWHMADKPRRDQKRVTINCYQWELVWLEEAE